MLSCLFIFVSWSTSELRVRLVPWNWFKPSDKLFSYIFTLETRSFSEFGYVYIKEKRQRSGIDKIKHHIWPWILLGKVTKTPLNITNQSKEVIPFPAGGHKAAMNRHDSMIVCIYSVIGYIVFFCTVFWIATESDVICQSNQSRPRLDCSWIWC